MNETKPDEIPQQDHAMSPMGAPKHQLPLKQSKMSELWIINEYHLYNNVKHLVAQGSPVESFLCSSKRPLTLHKRVQKGISSLGNKNFAAELVSVRGRADKSFEFGASRRCSPKRVQNSTK